jgi:hypothetical protein
MESQIKQKFALKKGTKFLLSTRIVSWFFCCAFKENGKKRYVANSYIGEIDV